MSTAWFSRALLPWYREHQRPLPWRNDRDPYRIWLSEVILQQTRVDQGRAYWHRFITQYPGVQDLAQAPEDEVLKLWQGLGYYSRARNLRKAAGQVIEQHDGSFPTDPRVLRTLKGVGDYTASAIASICFGIPEPVVDGNVYRVLARVFGIATPIDSTAGRREFRELASKLVDKASPGDHNQAVMELGATVCVPKNPRCGSCPVATRCTALATDRIAQLPVKTGRTKVRERHFNLLHIVTTKGIWLEKRTGKDIWHGLYQMPLIETDRPVDPTRFAALLAERQGPNWTVMRNHGPVKHVLSHQVIQALFWEVKPPKGFKAPKEWVMMLPHEADRYAVPRLIERYLEGPDR